MNEQDMNSMYAQNGVAAALSTARVLNEGNANVYRDRVDELLDISDSLGYLPPVYVWPTPAPQISVILSGSPLPDGATVYSNWYSPAILVSGPDPVCVPAERPPATKPTPKPTNRVWAFFGSPFKD